MSREDRIKRFAKDMELPYLVHFTHIGNIESIFKRGLLPRSKVDELSENVVTNDSYRHDRRENTISISIAHPNDAMFYKYRENDADWCVIAIKRSILWKLNCLFLKYNAADARMSILENEALSTFSAFKAMYDEDENLDSREDQCLKPFDPTDKQAEILVLENIPLKYILGVFVSSRQVKKKLNSFLTDVQIKVNSPNKGVYASRLYRRKGQ